MIIRTFEGYHEDFIKISFSRHASGNFEQGKKTQTQQVEQRMLHVYKLAACFVFAFPLRIRFAKDHHSDNHWVYLVIIIMLWSI